MKNTTYSCSIDDVSIVQKRLEMMLSARLEDKMKVKHAIEIQERLSEKSGKWSGANEIRKWRDKR
jgi:hypothetical protein